MNEIYLVINEENLYERWILDICTDFEYAQDLCNQYIENFVENGQYTREDAANIIIVEPVTLTEKKRIWSYDGQ